MINKEFGGTVVKKAIREDGQVEIDVDVQCALFHTLNARENVLLTHGDSVDVPADGFRVVAKSGELIAAIADDQRRIYGVQFHPEVDLTDRGMDVFRNFLFTIAKCRGDFRMASREVACIEEIRRVVGPSKKVLVSG